VWRERTAHAFDPGAQAIIATLRGANRESDIEGLLAELRAPLWSVDRAGLTARRLTRHAVSLDAIAKGYIVTRAAARAREVAGVSEVLLNIGGDIQHFGARPVAIGIADPAAPAENAPPIAIVRIANAAIATSGGYRRGFVANGERVSHIVDPRSGRPASHIVSASVFAPDCSTADALSTAFSVMDPGESVTLADTIAGVGCLLVTREGAVITNATWDAQAVASHDTNQSRQ
jgi:thiamine biosynthesis lipoprotein